MNHRFQSVKAVFVLSTKKKERKEERKRRKTCYDISLSHTLDCNVCKMLICKLALRVYRQNKSPLVMSWLFIDGVCVCQGRPTLQMVEAVG